MKSIKISNIEIMDVKEKLSKALATILKTGIAIAITKNGKYYGIIDDRHIRLGIKNVSKASLEANVVKAPAIKENELDNIETLVKKFLAGHFKALPVINNKKEVIGAVTRSDVMRALVSSNLIPKTGVSSLMATPPYTIEEDETFAKAKRLMKDLNVHRLIVVNNNKVVGVVSTWDFLMLKMVPSKKQRMQLITEIKNADNLNIKSFIREPLVMIDQYEMLPYATKEMADKNVSYAVIVDERKRPVGILSALDIFKMVLRIISKTPQIFIIGLGTNEIYYYEKARDIIKSVIKKFEKSFNIGHITIYVKKGKSVYKATLRAEMEYMPIYLTAESYDIEELFAILSKALKKTLSKIKEKLKDKKIKGIDIEVYEEEEYI